jgi:hypothetical protein
MRKRVRNLRRVLSSTTFILEIWRLYHAEACEESAPCVFKHDFFSFDMEIIPFGSV